MRKIGSLLAVAGLFGFMAQSSQAAVVTFAQFQEFAINVQNTQVFALTNPSGNQNDILGIRQVGENAVQFSFKDLAPTDLLGAQIRALVTLTAFGQNSATVVQGDIQQRFSNITETFLAKAPGAATSQTFGSIVVPDGTLLLRLQSRIGANAVPGDLFTGSGGNQATLGGGDSGTNNSVVFTSFYIPGLETHVQDDYSLGFTSITPSLARVGTGLNQGLAPFTAAGNGTFNTETFAVPEPSSVALLIGMGVSGSAFIMRRRKK